MWWQYILAALSTFCGLHRMQHVRTVTRDCYCCRLLSCHMRFVLLLLLLLYRTVYSVTLHRCRSVLRADKRHITRAGYWTGLSLSKPLHQQYTMRARASFRTRLFPSSWISSLGIESFLFQSDLASLVNYGTVHCHAIVLRKVIRLIAYSRRKSAYS